MGTIGLAGRIGLNGYIGLNGTGWGGNSQPSQDARVAQAEPRPGRPADNPSEECVQGNTRPISSVLAPEADGQIDACLGPLLSKPAVQPGASLLPAPFDPSKPPAPPDPSAVARPPQPVLGKSTAEGGCVRFIGSFAMLSGP